MKALVLLSLLMGLAACSPENPKVYGEREKPAPEKPVIPHYEPVEPDVIRWITLDGGRSQLDFNPQVDILFVVDNSASMKPAQENLSRNIHRFVEGFRKNRMIDYHIGVISVWDSSERFSRKKQDPYAIGELRRIKNPQGQILKANYVSRFQGADQVLASTLLIGIAPYEEGGPEIEEVFSPLAAALKKTGRGDTNEEFFRDEAQLVVVVITDADDSTSAISPEQMAQELFDFKHGRKDRVSAYAALVRKEDSDKNKDPSLRIVRDQHPECFDGSRNNGRCTGFGPDRLEQFILAANVERGNPSQIRSKHLMSLTQPDFGQDLSKIGSDITARTLAKTIELDQRPRQDEQGRLMIRVRYGRPAVLARGGGQLIPQKQNGGWLYDPENNSIRLSGDIDYVYEEGARFAVDLVPVTLRHQ